MSRTKGEAAGDGGMRSGTRMSQENRKEGGSGKEEEETEDNGEDDREERRGRRIVSWWLEAPSPRIFLSLSFVVLFSRWQSRFAYEVNREGQWKRGEWAERELESRAACAPRLLEKPTKRINES